MFNNTPTEVLPDTTEEAAIGSYLRGAWAAFAKDPMNGLDSYGGGWPRYSTNGTSLIRLAYNNQTGTNAAIGSEYDSTCGPIPQVMSPPPNSSQPPTSTAPTPVPTSGANLVTVAGLWPGLLGAGVMIALLV